MAPPPLDPYWVNLIASRESQLNTVREFVARIAHEYRHQKLGMVAVEVLKKVAIEDQKIAERKRTI